MKTPKENKIKEVSLHVKKELDSLAHLYNILLHEKLLLQQLRDQYSDKLADTVIELREMTNELTRIDGLRAEIYIQAKDKSEWTEEEVEFLKSKLGSNSSDWISKLMDRTIRSIENMQMKLEKLNNQ